MRHSGYKLLFVIALFSITTYESNGSDITSIKKGKWISPTTWSGGVVPTATDNVTISSTDTVTVDTTAAIPITTAECNNLTVKGMLRFSQTVGIQMTVNGSLRVDSGATFRLLSNTIGGNLAHTIALYGDMTNNGTFDMKNGSANATLSNCTISFLGPNDSRVHMNGIYTSTNNEFGGITINKSGTARVILESNIYLPSGSSAVTTAGANPVITFVHGVVETGPYAIIHLWTNSGGVVGASDSSYVLGNMGRGLTTSGSTTDRWFNVGTTRGYRPIKMRAISPGNATGHYMLVEPFDSNANTGSSLLTGNIDKVWGVRYYRCSYHSGGVGASQMTFDKFTPSYGRNEGIAPGNTNLRVAYSTDNRATWNGQGPTYVPHMTSLDTVPRTIASDSLTGGLVLVDGAAMYVTIARAAGTTENSLDPGSDAVIQKSDLPGEFELSQNYPNPFNPATRLSFVIRNSSFVSLKVYDILGREITTLVNERLHAGSYEIPFDGSSLSSGIYLYRLTAGPFAETKRMTVVK